MEWDAQSQAKKPDAAAAKVATPNTKSEATPAPGATPMNRQASTSRQGTSNAKAAEAKVGQKAPGKQAAKEPDAWADHTIDPLNLFQNLAPETGALGAINELGVYRSNTPNDTPESSKDGLSEPNSDLSEGVTLDINVDIFDESWQPFGSDADFLANMTSFNADNQNDLPALEDDPAMVYTTWDDLVDQKMFDKPFEFDNSLFSMNTD